MHNGVHRCDEDVLTGHLFFVSGACLAPPNESHPNRDRQLWIII